MALTTALVLAPAEPPRRPPQRLPVPRPAEASAAEILPVVTRAEGLLQIGRPDAALATLETLAGAGTRHPSAQRVRLHALLASARFAELREAVVTAELAPLELAYLAGAAGCRAGGAEDCRTLAELWWTEPDSSWGLAALRVLVETPDSGYGDREREAVLATVAAPTPSSYLEDAPAFALALSALRDAAPRGVRLDAEVALALGVHALRGEHFSEAVGHLTYALARAPTPGLRRAAELRLGEARRRQGEFGEALRHFERVAAKGDDALGANARAAAGQMAIEQQRYRDAQRIFRDQLLEHPVGEPRAAALLGLGWVAFRTGRYGEARQFFWALTSEAPYSRMAPAAAYWGARAVEELGEKARADAELDALAARFPFDYYAYRARERAATGAGAAAALPERPPRPEILQLDGLLAAGMERRARALVSSLAAAPETLGPDELDALASAADRLARPDQASRARRARCERFGAAAGQDCAAMAARFPPAVVATLAARAAAERVPTDWLVAAAYAASGLSAERTGDRGELGIFQLPRARLADLAREETRRPTARAEEILDAETNLRLGARYVARIARAFGGRLEYTLAALDAGPGAVTRWREARGELPGDIFVEEIPYAETREFVRAALAGLATHHALRSLAERPRPVTRTAAALTGMAAGGASAAHAD